MTMTARVADAIAAVERMTDRTKDASVAVKRLNEAVPERSLDEDGPAGPDPTPPPAGGTTTR